MASEPYIDGRAAEQAPGASRIYSNEAGLTNTGAFAFSGRFNGYSCIAAPAG